MERDKNYEEIWDKIIIEMLYTNPSNGGEIVKSLNFFKIAALEFARQLESDGHHERGEPHYFEVSNENHEIEEHQKIKEPKSSEKENDGPSTTTHPKIGKYHVSSSTMMDKTQSNGNLYSSLKGSSTSSNVHETAKKFEHQPFNHQKIIIPPSSHISSSSSSSSKPKPPIPISVAKTTEIFKNQKRDSILTDSTFDKLGSGGGRGEHQKENERNQILHESKNLGDFGNKRFSLQIESILREPKQPLENLKNEKIATKSQIDKDIRNAVVEERIESKKDVTIQTDKIIEKQQKQSETKVDVPIIPPPQISHLKIEEPLKPITTTETFVKPPPPPPISKPPMIEPKIKPPPPQVPQRHPLGATAICNDGTYSFSQNRRGTCSHHGGVSQWL